RSLQGPATIQGRQERQELLQLSVRQLAVREQRALLGVVVAAARHEAYGLFQRGRGAVVEVGSRLRHVAERRRLEGGEVRVVVGDLFAAHIDVRELLTGEADARVEEGALAGRRRREVGRRVAGRAR